MQVKKLISMFLLLFITGCATAPEMPAVKLSPQENIGLLVDVTDFPMHSHGKSSLFVSDSHRKYPFEWKLTQRINERFNQKVLQDTQFKVINLRDNGFSSSDVTGLIGYNKKWITNPAKKLIIDRLKKEYNISTVIVFHSSKNLSMRNVCTPAFCWYTNNIETGLYTRRAMFGLEFFAVTDVIPEIYILDAPTNIARSDAVKKSLKNTVVELPDFKTPGKITAIKEHEWQPVKEAVERSVDSIVDAVAAELKRSSL